MRGYFVTALAVLALSGCAMRERPTIDLWRDRAVTTFETRNARGQPPRGVLRAWFPDAPHRVAIQRELFPAAELVRHLDDHARVAWDSYRHSFDASIGPLNGDAEHARRMRALAKETFLGIHRVAGIVSTTERHAEAQRMTRAAYCEAARIPTPSLGDLPWWRDIARAQLEELDELGLAVEELDDGRIGLTRPTMPYSTGSAVLGETATADLREAGAVLARLPDVRLVVEGHTDPRDIRPPLDRTYATNLELGYARARAVESVLVASGVPADQIEVVSRAATRPPDGDRSPRRAEVVLDACPTE